jgi:hypothetical protein
MKLVEIVDCPSSFVPSSLLDQNNMSILFFRHSIDPSLRVVTAWNPCKTLRRTVVLYTFRFLDQSKG